MNMYCYHTTELELTTFQKRVINNGIRLQRNMWNFLIEYINPLVEDRDIQISKANRILCELLVEVFIDEIKQAGIGTRMIRSVVNRYMEAWSNCFNPNMPDHREPCFHSAKRSKQSLAFSDSPGQIKDGFYTLPLYRKNAFNYVNPIKQSQVQLKVCEDVSFYLNRFVSAKPKNSTIVRRKNRYFLCINYECVREKNVSKNGEIGLDWGLADYFIDSNGNKYNLPKSAERQLQRIKGLQKVLNKKIEGSKNYEKVADKLNNAWFRYSCIKKDYVEKLTLELCKNNQLIAIESLDLVEMRKRTHKNRRRQMNHHNFYHFKLRLVQKAENFKNCKVVEIDRWFPSSQLCSHCGKNTGKKPVSIREFTCPYCGTHHDRDINAAINILNEGKRMLTNG